MKKWIYKESNLLTAWAVIATLSVLFSFLPSDTQVTQGYTTSEHLVWSLVWLYPLACIRYIKGEQQLGVWGYIWRLYICTVIIFLFLMLVFSGSQPTEDLILKRVFIILSIPVTVWLLFCPNRIQFIKNLIMYFRGMPV